MNIEAGGTIPAGTIVLLTSGSYSSYGVIGIYRAKIDVVVPSRALAYGRPGEVEPDVDLLATLLVELPHVEVWAEN